VAALGAGASLPAARLNERRLARALGSLLAAPGLAQRTRAVAGRFQPDAGIGRMCDALEGLATA
jgi:rhamnosyltransferase subunit B